MTEWTNMRWNSHETNFRASCKCDTSEAWQWTSFPLTQLPHTYTAGFTTQFKDSTVGISAEWTDIAFCFRNIVITITVWGENLVSKKKGWPIISWANNLRYTQYISGIGKIFTISKCRHFTSELIVKAKVASLMIDTPRWNEKGPIGNMCQIYDTMKVVNVYTHRLKASEVHLVLRWVQCNTALCWQLQNIATNDTFPLQCECRPFSCLTSYHTEGITHRTNSDAVFRVNNSFNFVPEP
jgi:hypothetical protein